MSRVILIALAALALAVAGCGNAWSSKAAVAVRANALCVRNVAPLTRTTPVLSSPSMAGSEAQRAALAQCACIVCSPGRGRIDLRPYLEPLARAQVVNAFGQVGLIKSMQRISGPSGVAGFTAPVTGSSPLEALP
jgi:hypothetical protein